MRSGDRSDSDAESYEVAGSPLDALLLAFLVFFVFLLAFLVFFVFLLAFLLFVVVPLDSQRCDSSLSHQSEGIDLLGELR